MKSVALTAVILVGQLPFGARSLGGAGRRSSGGQALLWLLIAAGLITVVCVAIRFGTRLANRRRFNSHGSLFNGLCRTHGLNGHTRSLLKKVARHHKLKQPARLFTEPNWLDPASLRGSLRSRAAEVGAVRNRLFA